jgi:RNA polymerase sigma-70 factor (ECF subfamily)
LQEPAQPFDVRAALEALHASTFTWALACCRRDRARAEDVLHEAYVRVLDGRARFDQHSSFKTWLYGVVRIVEREQARRHRLRALLLATWLAPDEATSQPPEPTFGPLEHAIDALSARQREVVQLVFGHELTLEEAARAMGVTIGSARQHYARAKQRLLELLPRDPP